MRLTDATASAAGRVADEAARLSPPLTLPLSVRGLEYRAGGRRLLEDVSFRIERGAFTVVLGPNGAGKSLLLRLCHGLLRPARGRIDWGGMSAARARLHHAMVFQHPVLLRRSVSANVSYVLRVRKVPRLVRRERLRAALAATDLERLARAPARTLSGGEQQRLAMARAWAVRPEALLLDEPCANLDPRATQAIEALVGEMAARGTTVIMSTHDLAQARRLGRRVLFLNRGRLLEDARADAFFDRPQSADAQAFLRGQLLV